MLKPSAAFTRGSGLVALFAAVLFSVPRLNVKIGPIPVYFIDLVAILMLYVAMRSGPFPGRHRPFASIIVLLLVLALLSESSTIIQVGGSIEGIYIVARTLIAFSIFYSVGQLIRTHADVQLLIKAATVGLIVTGSLTILTSLSATRPFVSELLFSNRFLEPAADSLLERILLSTEDAIRGRSLVGVSILGATFINICWPLAALLAIWPGRLGMWRAAAMLACILAPAAVFMSYSRGPILGMILLLVLALFFGVGRIRRMFLVPVSIASLVVLSIGIDSELFKVDRLVNRTNAIFDNPYSDERESERLLAYIEPFEHVAQNPSFALIGEGVAPHRLGLRGEQRGKATHALFAKAYYSYGLIAACLYIVLMFNLLYFCVWHLMNRKDFFGRYFASALLAGVVAIVPWAAFGHAIVSTPRGTMAFFLLVGLLSTLRAMPASQRSQNVTEVYGGDRRNFAV